MLPILLLAALAHGDDRENWFELHDAMLVQSVDGDLEEAARRYERLVRDLPDDDRTRTEAIYRLAQARYAQGELDAARDALHDRVRKEVCRARCQDLLGEIALEVDAVATVPTRWTFEEPDHGITHPWTHQGQGSIRIATPVGEEDPALVWSTTVDRRGVDRLVVGFAEPTPPPAGVRFHLQSEARDAWIRVSAEDDLGRVFQVPDPEGVPARGGRVLEFRFADMRTASPDGAQLDPATLTRLRIADVTALEGGETGPNELILDDFEVF